MHTVSRRPLVILTEYLDQEAITWLSERVELVECAVDDSRFPELLARASGLVIRTYTIIDQAFLDQAPELKVVGRAGVGLDNVDLEACRARGIEVVNTPDANRQDETRACKKVKLIPPQLWGAPPAAFDPALVP